MGDVAVVRRDELWLGVRGRGVEQVDVGVGAGARLDHGNLAAVWRHRGDRERIVVPEDKRAFVAIRRVRSEEHTSELQSLMRISYAVFCLKKKKKKKHKVTKESDTNIQLNKQTNFKISNADRKYIINK